jgi:hypothetical protein
MPPDILESIEALLELHSGPEGAVARGLILKAVAARARILHRDPAALEVLQLFAHQMVGQTPDALLVRATVLDQSPSHNTHTHDPQALWERRGVIHDPSRGDTEPKNDGLFQRFTASCGPTTLQMMLAEADPILAFAIHREGLHSDDASDAVSDFQRQVLEAYGGISVGRREAHHKARINNALGRAIQAGRITESDSTALKAHLYEDRPLSDAADKALAALRQRYGGFPTDDDLARVKAGPHASSDAGMDGEALLSALHDHLSPLTGVRYRETNPKGGFARGQAYRHLDAVQDALQKGIDVPFGTSEPGHWMLLSAVKGKRPRRQFLVSDPDGGKTDWVRERDFLDGSFADTQFHLSESHERPYVDTFLLPQKGDGNSDGS